MFSFANKWSFSCSQLYLYSSVRKFFIEGTDENGENWYMTNNNQFTVIRGMEFRSANRAFDGMLKQMTKQGQSRPTQHTPVLESECLVKIVTYFQKAMLSPVMLRKLCGTIYPSILLAVV